MPCARDHICSLALRICLSVNNLSRHGWFGSGCAYKEQLGGLHLCKQHIYIWCRLAQLTLFPALARPWGSLLRVVRVLQGSVFVVVV